MKYIHFVIVCICLLVQCLSPAAGMGTEAMIHYSEPAFTVQDEIFLEQGYSLKVVDMNSKSGDILIELYLDGDEVELDDNFAKKDDPVEYVRSVAGNDDKEEDHLILRISPKGSVKSSDGAVYSTICIEQYLDPVEDVDEYLILDRSYYFDSDSELELESLYTLHVTDFDDDEVSLALRLNGKLLQEDEVKEGEYFYYTVYSDDVPETLFIANLKTFIRADGAVTVFLTHVSLKQQSFVSGNRNNPNKEVDIDVLSPVDGGLKAGRIAIINYHLGGSYSEVRILVDGELVDSRKEVAPGTYKAVTEELCEGSHKATLIMFDEDESSFYYEEFSVSANIGENIGGNIGENTGDNITGSIIGIAGGIAGSAAESFGKGNSSAKESSDLSLPALPSSSRFSSIISFIITVGLFLVLFMFFKNFSWK